MYAGKELVHANRRVLLLHVVVVRLVAVVAQSDAGTRFDDDNFLDGDLLCYNILHCQAAVVGVAHSAVAAVVEGRPIAAVGRAAEADATTLCLQGRQALPQNSDAHADVETTADDAC